MLPNDRVRRDCVGRGVLNPPPQVATFHRRSQCIAGTCLPDACPLALTPAHTVATTFADILFAVAATAIAVSQARILQSTARAVRHPAAPQRAVREWLYAVAPAVALVVFLMWVWTTMHPATLRVDGVAPGVDLRG